VINVNAQTHGGVLVLRPESEYLDVSNAPGFREQVKAYLPGHAQVALDMSHVQFVDSAALGAFLSCVRDANQRGVTLKLFALTPPVRATIQLVRLHRVLHVLTDLPEVLLSFGSATPQAAGAAPAGAR